MSYKFDKLINKFILNQSNNNQIIIKFSKGIKIKYISSYLYNQLNFKKNNLVNEDFYNLFPKNIRIKHYKAMMHYIIVEQKIMIKKNTYIFDSNYCMVPCEIIGNIIPHYGKSLLMIINLNLQNKDEKFYFMIDEKYSCISMSKNFEENYFLNMDILRKFEISMLDLLNIKTKIIKNYFKKPLNEIKKINNYLKKNNTEYYANNLFFLNSLKNFDYQFLFKAENDFSKFNKNKIIFNESEDIYEFTLEKPDLIQNLLNLVIKLRDSEKKDYLINNLTKKLLYYQKFIKKNYNIDVSFDKLFTLKKNNNTFSIDEESLCLENNKNFLLKFYIKIKNLYNTPLYIILFQDKNSDNIITMNNSISNYDTKITEKNFSIYNKNLNNYKSDLSNISSKPLLNNSRKNKYSIINKKYYNKNINLTNNNNDIDLFDFREQNKKKKQINSKIYIKIEIITIFLTVYCITLSLVNLIYQLHRIKRINTSISFLNHNSFLEHKINNIQHGLFTSAYYYIGLNNLTITNNELLEYLKLLASDLISSSKEYYDLMSKFAINYNLNLLPYTQGVYIKVGFSWKNETIESDMFREYYYINYYMNKFHEDNEKDIMNDIELLFYKKYLLNETKIIKTNFAKVLFFLVINYDITFRTTLDSLYYILLDENFIFLDKSLNKIILMEIFWCIGCISIFLSIFMLHFYFNKNLFLYMIKMFYDEKKEKYNIKKNLNENFYMKLKVSYFINFVKYINQENKIKILNIKKNFNEEKSKFEEINNENNLFSENKDNKLKLPIESPKIKLLKKDNDSLKDKNIQKNKEDKNFINFNYADASFNLDNSKLDIKKKEENENTLNNNDLLYFLNKKRPILNYIIIIIIIVLFLIYILIFYLHIFGIIKFTDDNNYMLHCFDNYVTYIWTLPFTLNTIRRNIMFNDPIEQNVLNFNFEVQKYIKNLYSLNQKNNFKIYDQIKYIWHQMNIPLNNEDIDLDNICLNYELCKKYIQKEDSFSKGGTILGYDLIANEINIIINDYTNLKAKYDSKNEIIPKEILKKFIFTKNFIKVQEHIDIIYSRIENRFYYSYFHDYEKTNNKLYNNIIIWNSIFFIYEIFVIIIILILIFFYMKKKEINVKEGSFLFNKAFFKDYE